MESLDQYGGAVLTVFATSIVSSSGNIAQSKSHWAMVFFIAQYESHPLSKYQIKFSSWIFSKIENWHNTNWTKLDTVGFSWIQLDSVGLLSNSF